MKKITVFLLLMLTAVVYGGNFTVNDTTDNVATAGTLRWAVNQCNISSGADTIVFAASISGKRIPIKNGDLTLTDSRTVINGDIDGDFKPSIIIIDSSATAGNGFVLSGSNCVLQYLNIQRFNTAGISINGTRNHVIRGCYIGTSLDGSNATGTGNQFGINITGTGAGMIVIGDSTTTNGRNLISGNTLDGIRIAGTNADSCFVVGNYIGLNAAGTTALPNAGDGGISISTTGKHIFIGTMSVTGRNVISGNTGGVAFGIKALNGNNFQILNNIIGLNAAGSASIPNSAGGISLSNSKFITLGLPGAGNIISGNGSSGVTMNNSDSGIVQGNFIGTDITGLIDLGNTFSGITMTSSDANLFGGLTVAERNIVAGNGGTGITMTSSRLNKITGNHIGLDINGTTAISNANGITLFTNSRLNTIGDSVAGGRNVIAGNISSGIAIQSSSDSNGIFGNYIGLNAAGTAAIANGAGGISITSSFNNIIGSVAANGRNIISGNTSQGISLANDKYTRIVNNIIGLNAAGTAAIPNTSNGISSASKFFTIGLPGAGNIISGNGSSGINLNGSDSGLVQGNFIGTDITGSLDLGNSSAGISMSSSDVNLIGGVTATARNIISGNNGQGITLSLGLSNKITGNYIGTNINGTTGISNTSGGINITSASKFNVVGDSVAGGGNVISGNGSGGISIQSSSDSNGVFGNHIGLNAAGTATLPNNGSGITIFLGSRYNIIGSATANGRNIISGNTSQGISLSGDRHTRILNNIIGLNAAGTTALPNTSSGIQSVNSKYFTIGLPGAGNIISGNNSTGIVLSTSDSGLVAANLIGTDITGALARGNSSNGIAINSSNANQIGGNTAGSGNIISGNGARGITQSAGRANKIAGNHIGVNAAGTAALGNAFDGIQISNARTCIIGDSASAAGRNVISGNGITGISMTNCDSNIIVGNYVGVNAAGTDSIANDAEGITLDFQSDDNQIGSLSVGGRNVISGNDGTGLRIDGKRQRIFNNIIGLNAAGNAILPNLFDGIVLNNASKHSTVGLPGAGNIISGNYDAGILLLSDSNAIQGNKIGTDVNGNIDLGNFSHGISTQSADANLIGGNTAGSGNVISGNNGNGIDINFTSSRNIISGNHIGVNAAGTGALSNAGKGILATFFSNNNFFGDTVSGGKNVISGNGQEGIAFDNADRNMIVGNFIGTDLNGISTISNGQPGILITNTSSKHNIIGNGIPSGRNLISGNTAQTGIRIFRADSTIISGNYIGTNAGGTAALINAQGIEIDSARGVIVSSNLVSGNTGNGIVLTNSSNARVSNNFIGTNAAGTLPIPNSTSGLFIQRRAKADSVTFNKIAFNNNFGILIDGAQTDSSILFQNTIYENSPGGIAFQNNAQKGIAPPRITGVALDSTASGRSAPNAFIQLYGDLIGQNQGRIVLGTTTADASGNWSKKIDPAAGIVITALQDSSQNTSSFSTPLHPFTGKLTALPSAVINFGGVLVGGNSVRTLQLTGTGGDLHIISKSSEPSTPFSLLSAPILAPDTLLYGIDTVSAVYRFQPTALGVFKDTMEFISSGNTIQVIFQGIAVNSLGLGGTLDAFPSASIDFDSIAVGDSSELTIKFAAVSGNVRIDSFSLNPSLPFKIISHSLIESDTLFEGLDTITATFRFVPSVAAGEFDDSVKIYSSGNVLKVSLRGVASYTGLLTAIPSAVINFGDVVIGSNAVKTIRIAASGSHSQINSKSSEPDAPFSLLSAPIPAPSLLTYGVDTVFATYRFEPTELGVFKDTMELTGDANTIQLIFQGTGVENLPLTGTLDALPSADIDFGTVAVGNNLTKTVRFAASGGHVRINSASLNPIAPFEFQSSTVTVPDTLMLSIDTLSASFKFAPSTSGSFSDTLHIVTSGNHLKIALHGIAAPVAPPVMTINILRSTITQQYAGIVIASDKGLSALSGTLTLGTTTPVTPTRIGNSTRLFSTRFRLAEGTLNITMNGTDSSGAAGNKTRNYVIGAFGKNLSLLQGNIELTSQVNNSPADGFVIFSASEKTKAGLNKSISDGWDRIGGGVDVILTSDLNRNQFLKLRALYRQDDIAILKSKYSDFDERKIGWYQYSEQTDTWQYIGGEGNQLQVAAKVTSAGEFAMFYNPNHEFLPKSIELSQNYPNPFNPTTTIRFGLPEEGRVVLTVYNILGQKVKELVNDYRQAGYHQITWNGKSESGAQASSGVYFYRLETVKGMQSKKMLLIK